MKLLTTTCRLCFRAIVWFLVAIPLSSATGTQTITLGEAVDNTELNWSTGGSAGWFGQTSIHYYDGDAAQSGAPASGESSWIETTVNGPGFLTFFWKVSTGASFDLGFYIDGVRQAECYSTMRWEVRGYSIASGLHTLRWDYAPFIQSSGDAGWLDKVTFGSGPAIVVDVPSGGETWYQRMFHSIHWVSSADVSDVKIELYKAGSHFYTITASTPSDGSYDWFVPLSLDPGVDYRIRVTSLSNPAIYDDSDSDFTIAPSSQAALGGALILDGVDDYAEAADDSELDLAGGSFTIEAWVNFQDLGEEGVFIKQDAYALHVETEFLYLFSHHCIGIDYPCGTICCTSSHYLSYGWHHVALVYEAPTGEARAYYDGTQRCSAACSARNSDWPLKVGKGLGISWLLEGAVDELRISSAARYVDNFAPLTEPFSCDSSTRALWHFDEFEGATVFHDVCGASDNVLVGHNGAHTEGLPARRVYLPAILKQ